jgi:hypothetical protein
MAIENKKPQATQARPPFQVIVAGLPRTGTTSMTRALEILLGGKVFDGGALSFEGTASQQRQLLGLAAHCPIKTPVDRTFVLERLAQLTEGCVASSDQPGCYFVAELLEMYPAAKVIVTTRERNAWWPSYCALWESINDLYAWSWLSPQLRRFCVFSFQFWRRVPQAVGLPQCTAMPMTNQEGLYDAHARYITEVVPKEQLFYFSVKDGWEPLCHILDVPVPIHEPFPHIFPRSWLTQGKQALLTKLKRRFFLLLGGMGICAWGVYKFMNDSPSVWLQRMVKQR